MSEWDVTPKPIEGNSFEVIISQHIHIDLSCLEALQKRHSRHLEAIRISKYIIQIHTEV